MNATHTENTSAKYWGRASIVNSVLLFAAAALQLDETFWVLVVTNFVMMHAVWLVPVIRRRRWEAVDFGLVKWPLVIFGVSGNAALFLWGERLLSAFRP